MTASRKLPFALVMLLGACQVTTGLTTPPTEGVSSLLLFVMSGDELRFVWAVRTDGDAPVSAFPRFAYRDGAELYVLPYGCPLDRLGLVPGEQTLVAPYDPLRIPVPQVKLHSSIDGDAQTPWAEVDALPPAVLDALRRLPLELDNICRNMAPSIEVIDQVTFPSAVAPLPVLALELGDDSVLLADTSGNAFRIRSSGPAVSVDPLPGRTIRGGVRGVDGVIWLLDDLGTLHRGHPDRGFEALPGNAARLARADVVALSASRDPNVEELFAVSSDRVFARWDGLAWTELSSTSTSTEIYVPDVLWVGPNEAMAVGVTTSSRAVAHYRQGNITSQPLSISSWLFSLDYVEGLGVMAGTIQGALWRLESGGWRAMRSNAVGAYLVRAEAIPLGMMYVGVGFRGGPVGEVGFYHPAYGFCRRNRVTAAPMIFTPSLGEGRRLLVELRSFIRFEPLPLTASIARETGFADCGALEPLAN